MTIGCQTYLRSHNVGVSHVAQAIRYRFILASLACTDMASEHMTERLSTSHKVVVIDIAMSTFEVMLSAVTIGGSVMD